MIIFIETLEDYKKFVNGDMLTVKKSQPKDFFRKVIIMFHEIEEEIDGDTLKIRKKH